MQTAKAYLRDFQNALATLLGGLEMAEEFFDRHPYVFELTKVGVHRYALDNLSPETGAEMFYDHVCYNHICCDRERVRVEDVIDPRD